MSSVKLRFTLGRFGQMTARVLSFDIPRLLFWIFYCDISMRRPPGRDGHEALTITFNLLSRELELLLLFPLL
jgi:hypothetical protein